MSHAGAYLKSGMAILNKLEEGKPHTSVTDWIEVLSSDRYDELSLDGIPELVESVNIQGASGTQEASRAIRKKLKYGNVHRQLRALVILRALTENAGKGFQLNWANEMLMDRLKTMAGDSLLDPKVKKRLLFVFHAWSIQYADEPRMRSVAQMYSQYSGTPSRRGSTAPTSRPAAPTAPSAQRSSAPRSAFDDDLFSHSWAPSQRGADTYADLAQARADAESRRAARDRQIALEQREAELERKEREQRRRQDMAALEQRRQKDMLEEQERRRKMKEEAKRGNKQGAAGNKQVKKFDLARERPNVMVSVANALQAANVLVNSMRHINREYENVQESPKVQENLDKAKVARRAVIRYIQVVQEEELVGTLLEANEKIVEAIQMYDKMSKPAALDSDSDHDAPSSKPSAPKSAPAEPTEREMDALTRRMQAQRLEAMRTGELQKMQDWQKRESARERQRREEGRPTRYEQYGTGKYEQNQQQGKGRVNPDLADLDFGAPIGGGQKGLQRPLSPDSDRGGFQDGGLSDFSDDAYDYDYNSSDSEYRARQAKSRANSRNPSRRGSMVAPSGSGSGSGSGSAYAQHKQNSGQAQSPRSPQGQGRKPYEQYQNLGDEADPFADDYDTPVQGNRRMQWTEI